MKKENLNKLNELNKEMNKDSIKNRYFNHNNYKLIIAILFFFGFIFLIILLSTGYIEKIGILGIVKDGVSIIYLDNDSYLGENLTYIGNGIRTYDLGDKNDYSIIPSVSADNQAFLSAENVTLFPEFMGSVAKNADIWRHNTVNQYENLFVGGISGVPFRTALSFATASIPYNATITKIELFYYLSFTNRNTLNTTEFRGLGAGQPVVFLLTSPNATFWNITLSGATGLYATTSGTNVSTTGWKNITLNQNAINNLSEIVNSEVAIFSIGINSTDELAGLGTFTGTYSLIEWNSTRPYLVVNYLRNNASAINITTADISDDAYISNLGARSNDTSLTIGKAYNIFTPPSEVAFITFHFPQIPDDAVVKAAVLRLNVTSLQPDTTSDGKSWNASNYFYITNMNNSMYNCTDSTMYDTVEESLDLYQNITNSTRSPWAWYSINNGLGYADIELGSGVWKELEKKINSTDCMTLGIAPDAFITGKELQFSSSEGSFSPQLRISYWSQCEPPDVGDWNINITCNPYNSNISVRNNINLSIRDNGILNLTLNNINFTGTKQYIFVYSGGKIFINRNESYATGFNK